MNRLFRDIIFNVLLVFVIPFVSCQAAGGSDSPMGDDIADKAGMNVKGVVTDASDKPIEGVVVNDGSNFTLTNDKGVYYLPTNLQQSSFVTISVPADYQLPSTSGIASGYYAKLSSDKKVNQCNFTLRERTAPLSEFTYLAISDPQVKNTTQLGRFSEETIVDLKNYATLHSDKEIIGMTLGDNVWDAMGLFPLYKATVSNLGFTIFHTIGNHDFDLNYNDRHNTTDASVNYAEKTYESFFGPTDYSFNIGNVHVVTMKSIDYFKNKEYTTKFSTEQLEWLKKDLSYVKSGSLVFLNLHAPTSNRSTDGSGNISNAAQLMKILKDYRVHIFAGHTHFYENEEVTSTIYEHNIGAACGAWWAGEVNKDGSPNGFLVVDVKGDDVKWHYKATGSNLNYQFRVYKPGEFATQPGYLVVNYWDWDTRCQVKWYEDGVLKGTMEQFQDEDQDYITMKGEASGYRTLHLFRATPSVGTKSITIEVTNRFGEVYTENVSI
nr:calcineurin-like phosphoesterase family protein [uncultured Bacteroides sp.]